LAETLERSRLEDSGGVKLKNSTSDFRIANTISFITAEKISATSARGSTSSKLAKYAQEKS
jgi:hypothetical protein